LGQYSPCGTSTILVAFGLIFLCPSYPFLVRDHRVTTRGRRRSWRCSARLSLLSHFPLELVSSLRYKTSISLTLLSAAWSPHGPGVCAHHPPRVVPLYTTGLGTAPACRASLCAYSV